MEQVSIEAVVGLPPAEFEAAILLLSPEEAELARQMVEEIRLARKSALEDLAKRLQSEKLDPIILAKRHIESRWAEDDRQYYGLDRSRVQADRRQSADAESDSVPPGLNLTASRTNIWTARIVNMVCPGSMLPGDITPTPEPSVYTPDGMPVDDKEIARTMAEAAASRMRKTIQDQFAECHLAREVRKASSDLCRYGVGVLQGPQQIIPKRTKFKRIQGDGFAVYDVEHISEPRPAWRHVNPRYFFPEMVGCIEDAGYCFELMLLSKREIASLAKQPGFEEYRDCFDEILDPDYKFEVKGEVATSLVEWNEKSPQKEAMDGRVAVWRFFGYLDLKDMQACGHEIPEDHEPPLMEIWFCDDKILRAETLIPDGCTRLPYYVTKLFTVDDTMFGGGIPYQGREAQASIHSLWRAAQHNVSVSAGVQLGYADGVIEPLDGDPRVRGPKTWLLKDESKSIKDALSAIIIPNNAEQFLKLLEIRIQLFDEEVNLPLIAQGQPDQATPTASGLALQMRAASVAIMNIGQNCEDGWVAPILESAYHYNMAHNPDESIKGDFDCVPRLVSDNVMREIKAQNLMLLNQMRLQDPEIAIRIKPDLFFPRLATALEQDSELFLTEEEVQAQKQQQQQPPDPKMLQVEVDRMRAEAEIQFRQFDRELDNQERMRELDIREREAQSREFVAIKQLEVKLAEIADAKQTTVDKIAAQIGVENMRQASKKTELGVKARVEAEKLAQKAQMDQFEANVESPNPRLA